MSNNFDAVSQVYDLSRVYPPEAQAEIRNSLRSLFHNGPTTRILEVGAGTGAFSLLLIPDGYLYMAVDISRDMLAQMHEKLRGEHYRSILQVGDAAALPFVDRSFDVVLAAKCLRHISQWQAALAEAKRVLNPGGLFIHIEEFWPVRPVAAEVRPKWEAIVTDLGYAPRRHPGPTRDELIMECLSGLGFAVEQRVLAQWTTPSSPQRVLAHLSNRGGSSTLGLPEELLEESLRQLRRWVRERFDDADCDQNAIKALRAVIARRPAE